MTGVMSATSPCVRCHVPFMYDPEKVPSIPVDPETNLPPDLGGDADKAVKMPICPGCCTAVNPERRRRGLRLFPEGDTLQALLHTPQRDQDW